jgi:hypothetical protein
MSGAGTRRKGARKFKGFLRTTELQVPSSFGEEEDDWVKSGKAG